MKLNNLILYITSLFSQENEVLDATNAQSLNYYGKPYKYRHMLAKFSKSVDRVIEYRARNLKKFAISEIPEWVKREDIDRLVNFYTEKGFVLSEINEPKYHILIISW